MNGITRKTIILYTYDYSVTTMGACSAYNIDERDKHDSSFTDKVTVTLTCTLTNCTVSLSLLFTLSLSLSLCIAFIFELAHAPNSLWIQNFVACIVF